MQIPKPLESIRQKLKHFEIEDRISAVYFLIKNNEVVYVGQTVFLHSRIDAHVGKKEFDKVLYLPVKPQELDGVESSFIRVLRPKLNRKTYFCNSAIVTLKKLFNFETEVNHGR